MAEFLKCVRMKSVLIQINATELAMYRMNMQLIFSFKICSMCITKISFGKKHEKTTLNVNENDPSTLLGLGSLA